MSNQKEGLSCGLDLSFSLDLNSSLDEARKMGFDFICAPIVHPRQKRDFTLNPAKDRRGPLTRSDMSLGSQDWSSLIVGKLSPWLQLDSNNDLVRKNSEKVIMQELNYVSHLNLPAVIISITSSNCLNLCRTLNEYINGQCPLIWIHVSMKAAADCCSDASSFEDRSEVLVNGLNEQNCQDTWIWWNKLRTICDSHKRLGVLLEMTADLPSVEAIERWYSEPIKAILLPTNLFLTDREGFPVLSRAHQLLVKKLLKLDVQLVISGSCRHVDKGMKAYQQHLDYLWKTQEPKDSVAQFAKGYEDYLQCPLQPLTENLESKTYEDFEKDPIKYKRYQEAIGRALLDRVPPEERETKTTVIMVLGSGRGPLVSAALRAAFEDVKCKVKVYAVEKNPNALVTLETLKQEVWGDSVTVISCDMRLWEAPEKADIIVSELIGCFSDNELSPECLDGAQRLLKLDSISIPSSYTSYLAPLSSSKLWNEVRNASNSPGKAHDAPFEMPYVVYLHNARILAEPQRVFTFDHPNWNNTDNDRYCSLEFPISIDSTVHGFAGYFHCTLYKDVFISTVPATHSPGMFSWFPMYFPIKEPQFIASGSSMQVHFWRINNGKIVWYEWCTSAPHVIPIHNVKGRSYTIGQ